MINLEKNLKYIFIFLLLKIVSQWVHSMLSHSVCQLGDDLDSRFEPKWLDNRCRLNHLITTVKF